MALEHHHQADFGSRVWALPCLGQPLEWAGGQLGSGPLSLRRPLVWGSVASLLLPKVLSSAGASGRETSHLPFGPAQPPVLVLIGAHWEAGLEQAQGLSYGSDSVSLILRCSRAVELDLGARLRPTESQGLGGDGRMRPLTFPLTHGLSPSFLQEPLLLTHFWGNLRAAFPSQ